MDTPRQKILAEMQAQISDFLMTHTHLDRSRRVRCVHCQEEICRVRAFMSLHDEQFGDSCIGPGRAWRIEIPYCPACEKTPDQYGCIHMKCEELNLPSVLEASLTRWHTAPSLSLALGSSPTLFLIRCEMRHIIPCNSGAIHKDRAQRCNDSKLSRTLRIDLEGSFQKFRDSQNIDCCRYLC